MLLNIRPCNGRARAVVHIFVKTQVEGGSYIAAGNNRHLFRNPSLNGMGTAFLLCIIYYALLLLLLILVVVVVVVIVVVVLMCYYTPSKF